MPKKSIGARTAQQPPSPLHLGWRRKALRPGAPHDPEPAERSSPAVRAFEVRPGDCRLEAPLEPRATPRFPLAELLVRAHPWTSNAPPRHAELALRIPPLCGLELPPGWRARAPVAEFPSMQTSRKAIRCVHPLSRPPQRRKPSAL